MRHEILPNGDLKISLQKGDRGRLFNRMSEGRRRPGDNLVPDFGSNDFMFEAFESLICNSELNWSRPEYIGALTDAPIIAIYGDERPLAEDEDPDFHYIIGRWEDPADGKLKVWTQDPINAWGFMNYCLRSPQEDLFNDGFVIFESGRVPAEEELAHA